MFLKHFELLGVMFWRDNDRIDGVLMIEGLELVMGMSWCRCRAHQRKDMVEQNLNHFWLQLSLGNLVVFNFVSVVQIELVQVSSDTEIVQDAGPNRRR